MGHDLVDHRVHSGGQVVQHAGGVGQRVAQSDPGGRHWDPRLVWTSHKPPAAAVHGNGAAPSK